MVDDDKALPARPDSDSYPPSTTTTLNLEDEVAEVSEIQTATVTRIIRNPENQNQTPPNNIVHPPRWASTRAAVDAESYSAAAPGPNANWSPERNLHLPRPDVDRDMPPPLSPRRPSEPTGLGPPHTPSLIPTSHFSSMQVNATRGSMGTSHYRGPSQESNSWLDSKADSVGSTSSSVHSRTSSLGIRRKHIRAPSGDTEAEFDAALDAAVEAAYDDGFVPMDSDEEGVSIVAAALKKVELAKERVRQSELESLRLEQEREMRLNNPQIVQNAQNAYGSPTVPEDFYDDESSEDEERMLEEMTRGYEIEDFAFGRRPDEFEEIPPRGDSQTWFGAGGAGGAGAGGADQPPVTELSPPKDVGAGVAINSRTAATPPPTQALPDLPMPSIRPPSRSPDQGVRSRRLSGQNMKQLKIETSKLTRVPLRESMPEAAVTAPPVQSTRARGTSSPERLGGGVTSLAEESPIIEERDENEAENALRRATSPLARSLMTKNYSSSSLRSARSRNMSLSNLDEDLSPGTPSSNPFASTGRLPSFSTSSTPMISTFDEQFPTDSAESLYLFDGGLQGRSRPGSPDSQWGDAPVALEPCPNDFMLRPFWLMRCLYQTLAHSRGGYLSSRVFVPQEVWKVKGVKLRNIEDKISTCDYLTAALSKLAQVDTCDADAVLEEMQALEGVLEQMTANLTRKLGHEVGVQSPSTLFKDSLSGLDGETPFANPPRSASISSKSSAPFSWRRLRAKNSSAGLASSYSNKVNDNGLDSPILETLPMTLNPTSRPPKRLVNQAQFSGPHANYMESLARLFDSAQMIGEFQFYFPQISKKTS